MDAETDDPLVRSAPDMISVSLNKTVQVRHLNENDDFSDEEDLPFDDYIVMAGKGDTDTVIVYTSLGKISQRAAERILLNVGGLKIAA